MPRDLFGDVQQPVTRVGSRSRYTVVLSLTAHAAVIVAIVAATVLGPVVLPGLASSDLTYVKTMLPEAPEPPLPAWPEARRTATAARESECRTDRRARGHRAWPDVPFDGGAVADVGLDTVLGVTGLDTVVEQPPLPPPPSPGAPIRVGGNIRPPSKIRDAAPVYPRIAQIANVQGLVILEALIGADGRVQTARVLRGHPLLDDAALTCSSKFKVTSAKLVRRETKRPGRRVSGAGPNFALVTLNFELTEVLYAAVLVAFSSAVTLSVASQVSSLSLLPK